MLLFRHLFWNDDSCANYLQSQCRCVNSMEIFRDPLQGNGTRVRITDFIANKDKD
jgi:hypothetical protein